MILILLIISIN